MKLQFGSPGSAAVITKGDGRKYIIGKGGAEVPYRFYHQWVENVIRWWVQRDVRRLQKAMTKRGTHYYGNGTTINRTGHLHVEVSKRTGHVVAVWYRCMMLPFEEVAVEEERARDMRKAVSAWDHHIAGIEIGKGAPAGIKPPTATGGRGESLSKPGVQLN